MDACCGCIFGGTLPYITAKFGSAPSFQMPCASASCLSATVRASGADSAFLIAPATAGELAELPYLAARSDVVFGAPSFGVLAFCRSLILTCPRRSSFLAPAPTAIAPNKNAATQTTTAGRLRLYIVFAGL